MLLSVWVAALTGLLFGATVARLVAQSLAVSGAILLQSWLAALFAVCVAGLVLGAQRLWTWALARHAPDEPTAVPDRDTLAHLPLLLAASYLFMPPNPLLGWTLAGGALLICAALRGRAALAAGLLPPVWAARALLAASFVGPLALYLGTLTPGVGTKDGFELQVVSATLGIAHPTGYPLIALLGRLFITLIPFGSPAYRVNLMCAAFAAAAVPLIYSIGRRALGRRAPALVGAACFALAPTFWTQASIPEKYALNVFFVALVLYVALRWSQEAGPWRARWLQGLALAYGLSLAHHRTMLLLAPGLVLYVLLSDPGLLRQPRRILGLLALFCAPLLLYLYIPWRAWAQGWRMTPREFLVHISGSDYAGVLRVRAMLGADRWLTYWRFVRGEFSLPGLAVAVVGHIALWLRNRRTAAALLVVWASYVAFSVAHHAYYNDINYFLPSHLVVALWLGAGLGALASLLAAGANRLRLTLPHGAGLAYWTLAALLPLRLIWTHLPQVDQSVATNLLPWGRYVLGLDIPANAAILADSAKVAPLYYLTRVEGVRSDLDVVVLADEGAYLREIESGVAQGRSVYLARYLPNLYGYHLRSLGPLVEVSHTAREGWDGAGTPIERTFGESVELLGYDAPTLTGQRQGALNVTLYWRAQTRIEASYHVRLSLVDARGRVCWEEQGARPVGDLYPTNAWHPGEVVPDDHEVPVIPELAPGDYELRVGLYLPYAQEGLPVDGGETDQVALARITVQGGWLGRAPGPSTITLARLAPSLMLVGADLPQQVTPGSKTPVRLFWRVDGALPDYRAVLALGSETVEEAALNTSAWPGGELIITRHELTVPRELAGQSAWLALTLLEGDETRAAISLGALAASAGAAADSGISFGQMLLSDYVLVTTDLTPGALFEMRATWQGQVKMAEDYTIFVHLLGPDGRVYGQVDVWPHEGTYPTSTWPVGEPIADTYRVWLAADAPPGPYQVEVGVYLLRTMARLPVLDAAGRPVDDKVLIQGMTVR